MKKENIKLSPDQESLINSFDSMSLQKKIKAEYSLKKEDIYDLYTTSINEQSDFIGKGSLKEKKYNETKDNINNYREKLIESPIARIKIWFYLLSISLSLRLLKFNYHCTNFLYIKSINKKKIFTANMAGEIWWKMLITRFIRAIFLTIMLIIFIFPFYWMISISFRSSEEIKNGIEGTMSLWPQKWSWDAYHFLFNNPNAKISITNAILNSFLIAIISTIVQVGVSLLGGFGLSYVNSRWKEVLIMLLLATMMLPGEALLIGQYMIITEMGLKNTMLALIIPFIGNAFTIYMFKNGFDNVNDSIKQAAKIDGVNSWQFFIKIAIPYIRTTIFTALLISFIASWNSILWPTMVIKQNSQWVTLPMILWQIMQSSGVSGDVWNMDNALDPQNLKMAAAIVAILPMFIIFVFTKKYLVKGITSTSGSKE